MGNAALTLSTPNGMKLLLNLLTAFAPTDAGDLSPGGGPDAPKGHPRGIHRHAGAFRRVVRACDDADALMR